MPKSKNGEDICPACRIRFKPEKAESCMVCKDRKENRLIKWLNNRENTIWLDEVADTNNRIALLTFSFDLNRWLDGTMVKTLFSQTFEDWKNGDKFKRKSIQNILLDKKINLTNDAYSNALTIAKWIINNKNATEVNSLLECFMEDGSSVNLPQEIKENEYILLSWFFTQILLLLDCTEYWQKLMNSLS